MPGDVSVIGYADSALMACTDPPLTTARQPVDAMGHAAAALLVSLIDGQPGLVVRNSTGKAGEFPTTILIVNKKFAAEHPDTVKALLRGHVKAVEWLNRAAAGE